MTAAWLTLVLAAAPKVLIAEGDHEGVAPALVAELTQDVRARSSAAQLSPLDQRATCVSAAKCVPVASKAGADAFLVVSVFAGPKVVTVDLDARKSDGSKLEVFTVNLAPSAHALPAESAAFFQRLKKALTVEEPPPEVAVPAPKEVPPVLALPAEPTLRSRAWIPLLPGGALVLAGAGLLINAAVIDHQIRDGTPYLLDDPTVARTRLDAAVNEGKLSQALAWTAFGLALGCVALAAAMYLFGGPAE